MKKIIITVLGLLSLFIGRVSAQQSNTSLSAIEPDTLNIAYGKTTNIVFPYAIKSVDRGSRAILAQKAKGVENVLQLKAAEVFFEETNLTVITSEGQLYSFVLNYDEQPSALTITIGNAKPLEPLFFSPENLNEAAVEAYSELAAVEKKNFCVKQDKYEIKFQVDGLFIRDDSIYCRIQLANNSNINYDIDQIRFFIRDKKKAKRTASQELEVLPLYIYDKIQTVPSQSAHTLVIALPKLTIPDKKYMAIQLVEKNGGRHLELHINNRKLSEVGILPELKY
jgi:conjugative transposon TraN protein